MPMLDPVLLAEAIEEISTCDAQSRLQRALRVIDSRVHDFTVARACPRPELLASFQDQRFTSANRKSTRHRESHDSRAYDDCIDGVHRDAV